MHNRNMNEQDKELLRERLKERRLFLNMTYQLLAEQTGISKSTLQRYEAGGIQNLPLDKLFVLSEALEVTPDYFFNLDKDYSSKYSFEKTLGPEERKAHRSKIQGFEERALTRITPLLIAQGYKVAQKERGTLGDIVAEKGREIWHLDFLFLSDVNSYPAGLGIGRQQLLMRFGKIAVFEQPITKYSIVIDRHVIAEEIAKTYNPRHIDITVSIIVLTEDGFEEYKLN